MINLLRSSDNQYYFTYTGRNGKVLMTSETYKRKPFKMALRLAAKLGVKFKDRTVGIEGVKGSTPALKNSLKRL